MSSAEGKCWEKEMKEYGENTRKLFDEGKITAKNETMGKYKGKKLFSSSEIRSDIFFYPMAIYNLDYVSSVQEHICEDRSFDENNKNKDKYLFSSRAFDSCKGIKVKIEEKYLTDVPKIKISFIWEDVFCEEYNLRRFDEDMYECEQITPEKQLCYCAGIKTEIIITAGKSCDGHIIKKIFFDNLMLSAEIRGRLTHNNKKIGLQDI